MLRNTLRCYSVCVCVCVLRCEWARSSDSPRSHPVFFRFFFLLFDLRTHLHIYIHSYTERAVEVGERKKRKERKLKSRTQPEIFRVVFISNVLHYVYAAQRVRLEAILIFAVFIDFNVLFFFCALEFFLFFL